MHRPVDQQFSAPAAVKGPGGGGRAYTGGLEASKAVDLSTHQLRHIVLRQQLLKPLPERETTPTAGGSVNTCIIHRPVYYIFADIMYCQDSLELH